MRILKNISLLFILFASGLHAGPSVLTYSMDELTRANYRDFGDLLDLIPGAWTRDLGSTGQWSSFRMSGASGRETLICLNGVPLQDAWTLETDLNWIPVDLIDSVQVYPSGNPFGLSAPGGLINLVARDGTVPRPESTFNYRTGSLGFSDLDLNFYQSITSDISYGFGALVTKYAQEIPSRSFEKQTLRGIMAIRLLNRIDIQYRLLMNKLHTGIPDLFYFPAGQQTLTSPFRKTDRKDHFFILTGETFKIRHLVQVHRSENEYEYRQRNHTNQKIYPVTSTTFHCSQDYSGFGFPVRIGIWHSIHSLSMPESEKQKSSHYRFYANTHIPLSGALMFEGHSSYTGMNRIRAQWNGSTHFVWTPNGQWSLRIGGSAESRMPDLGEQFGLPISHGPEETVLDYELLRKASGDYLSSDLNPEKNRILDAVLRFQKRSWLSVYGRAFYRFTSDLIRFDGDIVTPRLINLGRHRFYGFESTGYIGPVKGFKLHGTFNYILTEDENGNFLPERPSLWGCGALSWTGGFFEDDLKVHFRVGTKFRSEFWCLAGDALALSGLAGQVLEFKTILTFMQNADVFFSMDNLLDAYQFRVYGYPIANRSYRYGIKWKVFD